MIIMMFVVDGDWGCAGYNKWVLFLVVLYVCIFVCGSAVRWLEQWPLMGGLLRLVQRGRDWAVWWKFWD